MMIARDGALPSTTGGFRHHPAFGEGGPMAVSPGRGPRQPQGSLASIWSRMSSSAISSPYSATIRMTSSSEQVIDGGAQ